MSEHSSQSDKKTDANELLKLATLEIRRLRNQLSEQASTETNNELSKIAVIGMGCRFPGGVSSPDELWHFLQSSGDGIVSVPEDRWDDQSLDQPMVAGGFLNDIKGFDASFFNITPREAEQMDPQQRLLLEITHQSLEHAGIPSDKLKGTATGVFIGSCFDDYAQRNIRSGDSDRINVHSVLGNNRSIAAGRIAYNFDFKGPVIQIDTTCSSSLVAVHLATQSLQNGESDLALAGGVNLMLSAEATISLRKLMALSSDGQCRTFDEAADGYSRGEGCGLVVLKRLNDAIEDGDKVWAVIEGSAINHDGASNGLTAPNGLAQKEVVQHALNNADLEPEQIQYVEVHGTATPIGDPIELQALASVHSSRDQDLLVGSIKTNIGHLESAAGIAGLIKTALALEYGVIPPHRNLKTLSSRIPWETLPIRVVDSSTAWPGHHDDRYAGISSFGMSGTNVHVILKNMVKQDKLTSEQTHSPQLFCLSAKSTEALRDLIDGYLDYLADRPVDLDALAWSMGLMRNHYKYRVAIIASDQPSLIESLHIRKQSLNSDEVTQNSKIDENENSYPANLLDLAHAYENGELLDYTKIWYPNKSKSLTLPTYPFQRSEYWQERISHTKGEISLEWPGRQILSVSDDISIFDSSLKHSNVQWQDHQVMGKVLLPAAFYLSVLPDLASQLGIKEAIVTNLNILHPTWLDIEAPDNNIRSHWTNKSQKKTSTIEWQVSLYLKDLKIASATVCNHTISCKASKIDKPQGDFSLLNHDDFYHGYQSYSIEYGDEFR
ncbi:MAG: beta-ketoacyl synthase N-terminal-like domain-containing protein, partial [Pseudomonadota bacterium]